MVHSPYKTPRIFFIVLLSILAILMMTVIYFWASLSQINGQAQPFTKSERSVRAIGKAYVYLGYYELREFYLVTTDDKTEQQRLSQRIDSLWTQIQVSVKSYRENNVMDAAVADSLASVLAKYRQNSEQIKQLMAQGKPQEALADLMHGHHRVLLEQLEDLFQEIIELLPSRTKKLLYSEKKAYQAYDKGLTELVQAFLVLSVLALVLIQIIFEKMYRVLLFRRLIPIMALGGLLMLGVLWRKPPPQYEKKIALVEDYARFTNFMTYFNHYSTLECRHVLDSSRLAKRQLEEEMAVFRRSVRHALRDCRNKLDKKFKSEVMKLYDLRAIYFSKIVVPSMVFSLQRDQIKALYLLLPTSSQPDSLMDLISPDEISYTAGQNAAYTQKFQSSFDKILAGLDKYYRVVAKKTYAKDKYLNGSLLGLGVWVVLLGVLLWYFHKRKKWMVYKAKEHFLLKKQLN